MIVIDENTALESEALPNLMQSDYSREECVNGRLYHFGSGWELGKKKPPIVGRVMNSFRILPEAK